MKYVFGILIGGIAIVIAGYFLMTEFTARGEQHHLIALDDDRGGIRVGVETDGRDVHVLFQSTAEEVILLESNLSLHDGFGSVRSGFYIELRVDGSEIPVDQGRGSWFTPLHYGSVLYAEGEQARHRFELLPGAQSSVSVSINDLLKFYRPLKGHHPESVVECRVVVTLSVWEVGNMREAEEIVLATEWMVLTDDSVAGL